DRSAAGVQQGCGDRCRADAGQRHSGACIGMVTPGWQSSPMGPHWKGAVGEGESSSISSVQNARMRPSRSNDPSASATLNRGRPTPARFVSSGCEDSPPPNRLVHLTFSLVALITVALLNLTDQLVTPPRQLIQFIISELAPLLLSPTLELFPVPFDLIPIHHTPSFLAVIPKRPIRAKDGPPP